MSNKLPAGLYAMVNSREGLSLCDKDFEQGGCAGLVVSLSRLIMRPGLEKITALKNWRSDTAWKAPLILDAREISMTLDERILTISDYDGSRLSHSLSEVWQGIETIAPQAILCQESWAEKSDSKAGQLGIPCYITSASCGSYIPFDAQLHNGVIVCMEEGSTDSTMDRTDVPLVTNQPVKDALNGLVYTSEGVIDIQQIQWQRSYAPLSAACCCQSCQSGFSRAYAHHLLSQTPLLCHRLLAIHNLFCLARPPRPEHSERPPNGGTMPNAGDPSLRSG